MIGRAEIIRAAADVHADPRDVTETLRALGVDPDAAASVLGDLSRGGVKNFEETSGRPADDELQIAFALSAMVGFVVGVAVGREAAHSEDVP